MNLEGALFMDKVKLKADTWTLMWSSTVFGFIAEVFFLGYGVAFSILLRITTLPFNAMAGRFYGIWRDLWMRFPGAKKYVMVEFLVNSFAMAIFHTPVYMLLGKILTYVPWIFKPQAFLGNWWIIALFFAACGYLYGLMLDRQREQTRQRCEKKHRNG